MKMTNIYLMDYKNELIDNENTFEISKEKAKTGVSIFKLEISIFNYLKSYYFRIWVSDVYWRLKTDNNTDI